MTNKVKQRIEQIGRGEVPEGYKKTKLGVIPQEWEMTRLSKYLRVNNDKNNALKYSKEDVFSISGELGIVNQIELLGRSYAGVSVAPYGIVYPNNIVYTKSPLKANPYGIIKANKTGKTGIVSTLYAIYHCKDNTNASFVEHYFGLDLTLNNYLYPIVNIGAKHDMKISDENALKGYVAFPSLIEQERIAEILDTQDKLIALKEKRIAEKKQQKKYLMQQLLTGKKRLPGFTGEWGQERLCDFCGFIGGGTPDTKCKEFWEGDIPWLSSSDIEEGNPFNIQISRYITREAIEKSATKICPQGTILIVSRVGVGKIGLATRPLCTSQDFTNLLQTKHNNIYLIYALALLLQQISTAAQGTSIKGIPAQEIKKYVVQLPSIKEQQAIADILSQADKEIELLQKDLEEEKTKKKALMQLLLTGIVRV